MVVISWYHVLSWYCRVLNYYIVCSCSSWRPLKTAFVSCRSEAFVLMASAHKVKKLQFVRSYMDLLT